jgi:hypothetical protein
MSEIGYRRVIDCVTFCFDMVMADANSFLCGCFFAFFLLELQFKSSVQYSELVIVNLTTSDHATQYLKG